MLNSASASRHKVPATMLHLLSHDVSNLVHHIRRSEVFANPELRRKFTVHPGLVAETLQLSTAPFGHPE